MDLAKPTSGPAPIVVLIEQNPWLNVIGSDSPSFALYENGLVIFVVRRDDEEAYMSAVLNEKELDEFQKELDLEGGLWDLQDFYEASDSTDQPMNSIYVWLLGRHKRVSVYGSLGEMEDRQRTPKAFLDLFDELKAYTNATAQTWVPEKIEVMIWPYEYSPEEPLKWPAWWPDLNHSTTKRRGDSYSIYLAAEKTDEFSKLLAARREKQAVEISGKKWAVSYRVPFPSEELWMRSASDAGEE
jgi:hypothetical protein